jgi:hypothetical protein
VPQAVVNLCQKPWRTHFVYVGRQHNPTGLEAHPLANPYPLKKGASDFERSKVLAQYRGWFGQLPDKAGLLRDLWRDTEAGHLPLACWCVAWDGTGPMPSPLCHATFLAVELMTKYEGGVQARDEVDGGDDGG